MDSARCGELIAGARALHLMRGGKKEPAAEEQVTMDFAFATLVTIAPVQAGERYEQTVGKRARRNIAIDTHLTADDIDRG